MRLLVLRPEPGASATVARARALGWDAIAAPLFAVRALPWGLPDAPFDAVMATSANALRHGGAALARLVHLPLYAVGDATAAAARAAGFATVIAGDDDAAALIARAQADGVARLLHLVGHQHRAVAAAGMTIVRMPVYVAEICAPILPEADVTLLHSPRAATIFAGRVADRTRLALAAISPRAAAAAGAGWRAIAVAAVPTDAALLAAAAMLCEGSGWRPS